MSLAGHLRGMDRSGYPRYKSLSGRWELDGCTVEFLRVQADPFAPLSRVLLRVPAAVAGLPESLWHSDVRARGMASYLVRGFAAQLGGKPFLVDAGGQEVLLRSACEVRGGEVLLRFGVALPANGRRIDGNAAAHALCERLPRAVRAAVRWDALGQRAAREFVETVEDTDALRRALPELGLVAFVGDGANLARRSGIDDRRLETGAVPFRSPESLRVSVRLPNRGEVTGMGIPEGVTLIVGGGFHGKSTLLRALETGVYDHVPGDGRELVVADPRTAKIRSEDGRRVQRVDISAFVGELPTGADTRDFSTENASGSTSQAASLVEAVEAGARVLLLDEDTAATNLMIRDARMQALVGPASEPLTPFVDLVRPLYERHGVSERQRANHGHSSIANGEAVSTILVMGGSGDYLDVADRVLLLDSYRAAEVSDRAAEVAAAPTGRRVEAESFPDIRGRTVDPSSVDARVKGKTRIRCRGRDALSFGDTDVDLRGVEQIADSSQVNGIGVALQRMARTGLLDDHDLAGAVRACVATFETAEARGERFLDDFAVPRELDVAAALNRLRTLRVQGFR